MQSLTEEQQESIKLIINEFVTEKTILDSAWIERLKKLREDLSIVDHECYSQQLSSIRPLIERIDQQEFVQYVINLALFLLRLYFSKFESVKEALCNNGSFLQIGGLFSFSYSLTDVDIKEWQAFCNALRNSQVQRFDLIDNNLYQINAEQWRVFCEALQNSQVQMLNLFCDGLDRMNAEQWGVFCGALQNSQVQTLRLSGSKLYRMNAGQWGVFGEALRNSQVQTLNLIDNDLYRMNTEQLEVFGEALQNSQVQTLSLCCNGLGRMNTEQWGAFCEALRNSRITSIDLSENSLSEERQRQIRDIIKRNLCRESLTILTALIVGTNKFKPSAKDKLSQDLFPVIEETINCCRF